MNDPTMNEAPPALPPETGNAAVDSRARHDHFAALTAFYEKRGASAPATATPAPGAAPVTGGSTPVPGHPEMRELVSLLAARRDADGKRLADVDAEYRQRLEATRVAVAEGRTLDAESRELLEELRAEAALDVELDAIGPDDYRVDAVKIGDDVLEVDRRSPLYRAAAARANALGLSREQFAGMLAIAAEWEESMHGSSKR